MGDHLASNQVVGSSNLSGRAISSSVYTGHMVRGRGSAPGSRYIVPNNTDSTEQMNILQEGENIQPPTSCTALRISPRLDPPLLKLGPNVFLNLWQ